MNDVKGDLELKFEQLKDSRADPIVISDACSALQKRLVACMKDMFKLQQCKSKLIEEKPHKA